jgi:hypothetical protein
MPYSTALRPFLSKLDPSIGATIALLNTSSCSRACSVTFNPKSSFGPTRVTRRENGVPCVAISSTAPKTKKYYTIVRITREAIHVMVLWFDGERGKTRRQSRCRHCSNF